MTCGLRLGSLTDLWSITLLKNKALNNLYLSVLLLMLAKGYLQEAVEGFKILRVAVFYGHF